MEYIFAVKSIPAISVPEQQSLETRIPKACICPVADREPKLTAEFRSMRWPRFVRGEGSTGGTALIGNHA
jgi:hypothetical protein